MMKKILLIEPNYKNKYPPLGLMKIATYHKMQGDTVRFFKGNVNDLIVENRLTECLNSLKVIKEDIDWSIYALEIKKYLKYRRNDLLWGFLDMVDFNKVSEVGNTLRTIAYKKPNVIYDRIYITTLFTFYWNITVKAIQQAKKLVRSNTDIYVGGVMASLLYEELIAETGITPIKGLLDRPGILDSENDLIIDDLPLDYSILEEIEYEYPTQSAYFTFMTKGCTRTCTFCSVPKLEPTYRDIVPAVDKYNKMKEKYGEPRNLLLMDNNVLASPRLPEIVQEIKEMGFHKGATYVEPNQLDIAFNNLTAGENDRAFINLTIKLLFHLYKKRLRGKVKDDFGGLLKKHSISQNGNVSRENILAIYNEVQKIYEKYRNKIPVSRYVDFNQGIDGRYVNETNMALLSQLNIKPLRIAFDFIGMRKQYINAVELAAKYGIKSLSNYILYNFNDHPEDLYDRLRINVELNKRLGLRIFSFPMKYIPLFGEEAKHRKYVGQKWNPKFIRTIQSILNSTKGIVAPGSEFFELAFGKNKEEFNELLYMPETFIVYRMKFEEAGLTQEWRQSFHSLSSVELLEAKNIIEQNNFENIEQKTSNIRVYSLLKYYTIKDKMLDGVDKEREKLRIKFNRLIKQDMFFDLTLTYDYDRSYRKKQKINIQFP